MTFSTLLDRRVRDMPGGKAIGDSRGSYDNEHFLMRVRAVAGQLASLGIGRGDVVAVRLANRVEFVFVLFAAWRIGACVTPVNPALTDREVARQLSDSGAKLLIIEDGSEGQTGVDALAVAELWTAAKSADPEVVDDPSAIALLIYTSGTTGAPKGVMLDHANLDAMTEMGRVALQLGPDDRCLLILPLFHVNGIVVSVLSPLLVGASVSIADRFNPAMFFDLVEAQGTTFFSAVPTIYNMLAALPDDVRPDTSSIRYGLCGAAPAPPELLEQFENRYGFPIIEAYGLSEATCGSTINPLDGPRKTGTVGVAFPGQEIRIADAGESAPVGVDGEVLVRGANVMRGYLGRPEETAATIVDGWLHTGDVGHLDTDGFLTLVGRVKDMIIRGGENIYPKEVEDVLSSDPNVLQAAVIGVPDVKWGEVVVAYVQGRPGVSVEPAALADLCAASLSPYKRPTKIHVVDALPTNAVGKIDKKALRTRGA